MRKTAGILGVFRGFSTEKHFKFAARWLSKRAFSSCLGIYAERAIKALIPSSQASSEAIEWARCEIWDIYHKLLGYKKNPTKQLGYLIEERFDAFCTKKTECHMVNIVLKKFQLNKAELLMALKHPF